MALLFADSFDHYATADITEKYAQIAVLPSTAPTIGAFGRRSTSGMRWTVAGAGANRSGKSVYLTPETPTPSGATCIVGFAFTHGGDGFGDLGTTAGNDPNQAGASPYAVLLYIRQGSATQVYFRLNTSGQIEARLATSNTLLGTSSVALSQGVTHYLEFKVLIHDTAGTVEVRKDGFAILTLTNQDTLATASATWDEIAFGHISSVVGHQGHWSYDDLYVADGSGADITDFMGDVRVDSLGPDGEGTTLNFTPSTGSTHYTLVDEATPNDDTDYNESSTVGHIDTLTFGAVPISGATVKAVQVVCSVRRTDAGVTGHKAMTRIGGTNYAGTEYSVSSSYSFRRQVWEDSPATATAWTDTEINGAEFGYQKSS